MSSNLFSTTAENNAAVRALEALRPAEQRICYDPQAKFFLAEHLSQADDQAGQLEQLVSSWETILPGICNAILVRTRLIDDCLIRIMGEGLDQLVILGAGYDTRVLRLDIVQRGIKVFELDHPATQAEKLRRFKRFRSSHPSGVTYVPILFGRDDLRVTLANRGYDSRKTTFFIWEGVSYYLSSATVNDTLAFIAQDAPMGSAVVFDYFPPSIASGSSDCTEGRALYQALKQMGETLRFGLDPNQLHTFLNHRGFRLIEHLSMADCKALYLPEGHRNRHLSDIFAFALARVRRGRAGRPRESSR